MQIEINFKKMQLLYPEYRKWFNLENVSFGAFRFLQLLEAKIP